MTNHPMDGQAQGQTDLGMNTFSTLLHYGSVAYHSLL